MSTFLIVGIQKVAGIFTLEHSNCFFPKKLFWLCAHIFILRNFVTEDDRTDVKPLIKKNLKPLLKVS